MALGDSYANNTKVNTPTVFGPRFTNADSNVDPSALSTSWWNKMLKITISPKLVNGNTEYAQFDNENNISTFLSIHTAYTFKAVLQDFIKFLKDNPEPGVIFNRGVPVKAGVLLLSDGSAFNAPGCPCIAIMEVSDSGNVNKSYMYEFKRNSQFSIEDFDSKTAKYSTDTESFVFSEIELLLITVEQYINAATSMTAGSVNDQMYPYIRKIADNLGVSIGYREGRTTRRSTFFTQNHGSSATNPISTTLDEFVKNDVDDDDFPF